MKLQQLISRPENQSLVKMKDRQQPLMDQYKLDSSDALVLDHAHTSSEWTDLDNPLATAVRFDKSDQHTPIGVHHAVGGDSDMPTPGDILCGALAACLDSTIRIIANRFDLKLKKLNVEVVGKVDVRGTLRVDRKVPVAFQSFEVTVDVKARGFVPGKFLDRLIAGAEQSCIVMQTLSAGSEITVSRK
jgi:uncharacterized OsmC-like protein